MVYVVQGQDVRFRNREILIETLRHAPYEASDTPLFALPAGRPVPARRRRAGRLG
jgi:hypothetical protein